MRNIRSRFHKFNPVCPPQVFCQFHMCRFIVSRTYNPEFPPISFRSRPRLYEQIKSLLRSMPTYGKHDFPFAFGRFIFPYRSKIGYLINPRGINRTIILRISLGQHNRSIHQPRYQHFIPRSRP